MAKKKKTRRDTAELARDIVEQVTGGKLDGDELDEQPVETPKGSSAGGNARAKKLSDKRRSEIAKKAAQKRWSSDTSSTKEG